MDSPDRLNVIVDGSKVIGDMITESNLRVDGEVVVTYPLLQKL